MFSQAQNSNPMKDIEVTNSPDDAVSSMEFSPATLQQNFLVAGEYLDVIEVLVEFGEDFLTLPPNLI